MARKSRKNLVEAAVKPAVESMKLWQAALYIRLSVEFNSGRGDSLETQRQIMEAYAALQPDIAVVEVYVDNGITGRSFERPAFEKLLADVDSGKINCILVKDLSRLGRSTIDTGYYIEKYFPLRHVRFIAVNDQYDSEEADNSSHILVPLKNMMNEAYAADISKKVWAQQRQSMKEGAFVGGRPPYGYKKAPDNCHKLLVNEETAPIVRQIFRWAAEGTALGQIVRRLNEQGVLTPGLYMVKCGMAQSSKCAGSGKWTTWTVQRILVDQVYLGDMVQGKSKVVGHKQFPVPQEEWIRVHNTHEPIISRELFEKVQAVRKKASEKRKQTLWEPYTENILRGRIFCGHCGKNLHRQRKTWDKRQYYYHCISNERIEQGFCAGNICIDETTLLERILDVIKEKAAAMEETYQKAVKDICCNADLPREIERLRQEAADSQGFLAGLYEHLITGDLTREEYCSMKKIYEKKATSATGQIQALERRQKILQHQIDSYVGLTKMLAKKRVCLTAEMVNKFVERITVYSMEHISVRLWLDDSFSQLGGEN